MEKNDKYLYGLDILRIISTVAVLIYHISPETLPGGYLAVCVFLVLHGYLFVASNNHKEHFSIIKHFGKRIIRLYLPLVIVTALTIFGLRYAKDIIWLNERPETLSVLGAYNNWWQISAGQSYFSRVTNSPFTHMWYISMLLQVELVLPFVYKIYSLIRNKANFWLTWLPFCLLTVIAMMVMPYLMSLNPPVSEMRIYFGTDARVFSILMGMTLSILHDKKRLTLPVLQFKVTTELLFIIETGLLCYMFLSISETSPLYKYSFVLSSLLTLLIISLCTNENYNVYHTLRNPVTKAVSSISYEVYLTHYPLLFFATALTDFNTNIKIYYVVVVIVLSTLLHFALSFKFKKDKKEIIMNVLKVAVLIPFLVVSFFGGQDIYNAPDYTEEMANLEKELAESAELQEKMQQEYLEKRQREMEMMNDPVAMAEVVDAANLPVTGIGDSVMLGAVYNLYETFPNGDFDAKQNRSYYALYSIVEERSADGTLGNPVVIGIGTNSRMPKSTCEEIIEMCGDRYIYWLTITNDWQFPNNEMIRSLGEEHDNVTVLDWEVYSADHDEYFYYDGIHLTPDGRSAYANYVLESISKDLLQRKLAEEKEKQVMGIGDGFMLTSVDYLKSSLEELYMIAGEDLNYENVLSEIQTLKDNDALPSRVFIAIGNDETINVPTLRSLLDSLSGCKITLIKLPVLKDNQTNKNIDSVIAGYPDVNLLSWENKYQENPEYFTPDRIHFNDTGSKAFAEFILEALNNN